MRKLFALLAFILLATPLVVANIPDPGHPASDIGPGSNGTFSIGDFVFPRDLNITRNLTVEGNVSTQTVFTSQLCLGGVCQTSWPYPLGNVSSEGMTNYVPLFTNATTIGNSVIYQNGTRIGINTTAATQTLTVQGSANISNGLVVSGALTLPTGSITSSFILDGTVATADLADSAVTSAKILSGAVNATKLNTTNAPSSGQVLSYNTTTGQFTWIASSSGSVTGTGVATRIAFWDTASSLSSNANLYWDNGASRLGIGTAAPAQTLTVVGTANITSTLLVGSTLTASNGFTLSSGALSLPTGSVTSAFIFDGGVATVDLANSAVTYAKIQNASAGYTILAKATTGSGAYAELAAGTDGVLRRSGAGDIAFGTIVTNNIADNAVTSAKIVSAAVNATKLNATNTASNGQVLSFNSTTGQFTWATGASGSVTSVGAAVAGTGAVAVSGSPITSSGTITFTFQNATAAQDGLLRSVDFTTFNNKAGTGSCPAGQVVMNTTTSGVQCVTLASGSMSSWTVGASAGSSQSVSDGQVVNFSAGTGINTTILGTRTVNISLTNTGVTGAAYGNASHVGTFTVDAQGRLTAASSTAIALNAAAITGGTLSAARGGTGISGAGGVADRVLFTADGTSWSAAQVTTNSIADNAITNEKIRDSTNLSVIGRTANTAGDPADIAATLNSGAVLRESSGTLGFGTIATAGIADNAVTYAKMQDVAAASRLIGRGSAAGAGNPEELTVTGGIEFSGTAIRTTAFTGDVTKAAAGTALTIANNAVTSDKIGSAAVNATKLNATNTASNGQVLSFNSTTGQFTWATASSGTVTSVGGAVAGTTAVSVSGSPITSSGTLTFTFQNATAAQDGLLRSADFTTFNNKAGTGTASCAAGQVVMNVTTTTGAPTVQCVTLATGSMSSWTVGGATGTPQTVSDGQTVNITGGTGITTSAAATRTVTVTLANTAVGAGSYGNTSHVGTFTVDAQGRLTAAGSSGISIPASAISSGALAVARGGTGLSTVAAGSVLVANSADTLSALTSTSGLTVLQNSAGTMTWATTTGTGNVAYSASPTFTGTVSAAAVSLTDKLSSTSDVELLTSSGNQNGSSIVFNNTDGSMSNNQGYGIINWYSNDNTANASGVRGYIYGVAGSSSGASGSFELAFATADGADELPTERLRITRQGNLNIASGTLQMAGSNVINITGGWAGTTILVTGGGTGASDAANARTNLAAAGTGNCAAGQAVMNTTTSGVQCITIGTGTVGGSGAANHIAYWTGASTIAHDANQLYWDATNNRLGIGTATPSQALSVAGSINVSTNIFYGGNLTGYGADFAEKLIVLDDAKPGDVVCLAGGFTVRKCAAYADKRVAGVVSTHATIIGNEGGAPNGTPIGIVGILPTRVRGIVAVGDMLTTSRSSGAAQKATGTETGAIIGKAMDSCNGGECTIRVLVSLR